MAKKGAQERRGVTVLDRTDISLINGNVLVEIDPLEYMMLPSGMILGDAESFLEQHRFYEAAGHSIRHGRVVTLPREKTIKTPDIKTEVRVKVGDVVWWFYDVGNNAEVCKFEEKYYYIMNYLDMIVLKRDDYIETLNGHLLCETEKRFANSKFDLHESEEMKEIVTITHDGNPVEYTHFANNEEIVVGDKVLTTKAVYSLEYELHLFFNGKMNRVIKRKDIYAKFL